MAYNLLLIAILERIIDFFEGRLLWRGLCCATEAEMALTADRAGHALRPDGLAKLAAGHLGDLDLLHQRVLVVLFETAQVDCVLDRFAVIRATLVQIREAFI